MENELHLQRPLYQSFFFLIHPLWSKNAAETSVFKQFKYHTVALNTTEITDPVSAALLLCEIIKNISTSVDHDEVGLAVS